ncbi:MAG: class I SAM-dependent methyltransferase [Oligoflexales bacterium]
MRNDELKEFYNEIYIGDKNEHFLKYRNNQDVGNVHQLVYSWLEEQNLSGSYEILDFGCGEGGFLGNLNGCRNGVGLDYSSVAIETAINRYPNVQFILDDITAISQFTNKFDVVTSFGTIEHVDDPVETLKSLSLALKDNGIMIISCPSFLNIRGVIWMTLVSLFDVPMSLSDKHFITIQDFRDYTQELDLNLIDYQSVDFDVAQGSYFEKDMSKRLNNALRDNSMDNKYVSSLIEWVERNKKDFPVNEYSGAEMVYFIKKIRTNKS